MARHFFLVWNPAGRNPTHRHGTYDGALAEARRLADLNPGAEFYVLRALSLSKRREPVETEDLHGGLVPF